MHALNIYPTVQHTDPSTQTRKEFVSDQEVRWCPGCGDYSILAQVQRVMPTLGIPRENFVFVSGIGCSSRFPYYMNTFGMHTIHGRAPAIATGLKAARPDLSVWLVTGDGDGLSIGGNHFMHVLRRNVDIKLMMFNNRIYGLTKGQYSPTSEIGKKTKSTPMGSVDYPISPAALALGAGATFVARSVDVNANHLQEMLTRVAQHKGTAFLEIYQNCNIFNDGAFDYLTDKATKADHELVLKHGQPMRFGKDNEKGIMLDNQMNATVVNVADVGEDKLLIHDETNELIALTLSRLTHPQFPTPIGVMRAVERPSYDAMLDEQVKQAQSGKVKTLQSMLDAGSWTVK